jgi:hypothetical protein
MPTKNKATTKSPTHSTKVAATTKTTTTTQTTAWSGFLENLNREDNIHMLIGIILLVIGLYQLRARLLGLIFIIVWILFVTGYFEKGKKK